MSYFNLPCNICSKVFSKELSKEKHQNNKILLCQRFKICHFFKEKEYLYKLQKNVMHKTDKWKVALKIIKLNHLPQEVWPPLYKQHW